MSEIKVIPVESDFDKKRFIEFPYRLYASDSNWVEPLRFDVKNNLDTKKNPFYSHARLRMWIAVRNSEVVGRIAAIVNDNHNSFHNEKTGFFGFFESLDEKAVSALLFDSAMGFLRDEGMKTARGPVSPSTNDECGLLVSGFDKEPVMLMPYNPPYYEELITSYGFQKAKDMYAFWISKDVIKDQKMMDKLERITEMIKKREGIVYRNINMKDFNNEVRRVKEVYNDAWSRNWGFVPLTDDEINHLAKNLKMAVDPDFVQFAEIDGKPVGFSLTLPDINQAIKGLNGKLFPFGVFKFLANKKKIDRLRVIIMGVKKDYQKMGIDAGFYRDVIKAGNRKQYTGAEISWVLEDNLAMVQTAEKLGARIYKTFRIFDKEL
ncbi:MAG: N-acetyltransferase [Ignavibacteria bacterium]|nr:N-acetyltransferase [Ignavibacteria bacterium]